MLEKRPLPPGTKLHSEHGEKVFSGVRFDIYQWPQKQFDGSEATYEIAKRNDSVIVLPIVDNEYIIIKEEQPHWEKPGYTLVAGSIEPGENLEAAARRELEEETGLLFENFRLVHIEPWVPAVEWFAYTFVATGYAGESPKRLEPGERTEVIKIPFEQLIKMTRNREFFYRPRFIEDLIIQEKIDDLADLEKNIESYTIPNHT